MPFANRKTLMLTGLLLLLSVFVSAETLTLEQCIDLALKNHPNVISARGNVKTANAGVWNAFGNFLPRISAGGQVSQTNYPFPLLVVNESGEVINTGKIRKNYLLSASAQITIFNGGRNIFDYMAARADKAKFEFIKEQTEQNLIQTVKSYYYAYLATQKLGEVSREAVKRGEEQYKLAESKYEVGSASKSDVLKAKVQYGNDRLSLFDAENRIKKARADLAYLIGADVNSDIEFSSDYQVKGYDGDEMDALRFGMSNFPGLLAREKSLTSAKNGVKSAWGRYLPTIATSVQKYYQNEFWHEAKSFNKDDGRLSISTSISIPIFENFSRKRAISGAKVALNNARADYSYAKNSVALEIKKAFLDMKKDLEKVAVATENVEAASEDMSLVREKYNLGAATILELLDAQVSLLTAQNDKIQSEFNYNLAVAKLENVMGVR